MKHISILPLYDETLTRIESSHQILTRVNDCMKYQGKPSYYNVEIEGLEKETELGSGLYKIYVNRTINEVKKTGVIVLPLLCGDFPGAIIKNKKYADWLMT